MPFPKKNSLFVHRVQSHSEKLCTENWNLQLKAVSHHLDMYRPLKKSKKSACPDIFMLKPFFCIAHFWDTPIL